MALREAKESVISDFWLSRCMTNPHCFLRLILDTIKVVSFFASKNNINELMKEWLKPEISG